jgi:hypothetical protein
MGEIRPMAYRCEYHLMQREFVEGEYDSSTGTLLFWGMRHSRDIQIKSSLPWRNTQTELFGG